MGDNMTVEDVREVSEFVRTPQPLDSIGHMEENLAKAIAYSALVGEAINEATFAYERKCGNEVNGLMNREDLTETTRKAMLASITAEDKKLMSDLKGLSRHLRSIEMMLMQAIRTRREGK